MPLPVPLIAAAIPSVFRGISGLFQRGKGRRALRNLQRPEYQIPDAVNQSVGIAQRQANSNMPGYDLAQQNIGLSQSNMIEAARQGAGGIGSVAQIQGATNQAYQQLGAQNVNYNNQMQANLQRALQMLAGYKDQEWQMNEFAPYKDAYNRAQGMISGGNQNINSALGGLTSLATAQIQADSNAQMFANINGGAKYREAVPQTWGSFNPSWRPKPVPKIGINWND